MATVVTRLCTVLCSVLLCCGRIGYGRDRYSTLVSLGIAVIYIMAFVTPRVSKS